MRAASFLWCFLGIFIAGPSIGASFDCRKASTTVEKSVCDDQELSALDERYARAYRQSIDDAANLGVIKQDALAWLRHRNSCQDTQCIKEAYLSRIEMIERQELQVARSSVQMADPIDRLDISNRQTLTLLGWVVAGALVTVIAMGLTGRIVIFYDAADAWWSISPLLSIAIASVAAATLAPEGARHFASTPVEKAVLAVGAMVAIYGLLMTFTNAIRYNRNVLIGLFVGLCKATVSLLMAVTFIGAFHGAITSKHTARQAVLPTMIVLVVGFLWVALINGKRVYEKRGWQPSIT